METGEDSLGCPAPGCQPVTTEPGLADLALEIKNLPDLRLEASSPWSVHKPYRRGPELMSLLHQAHFLRCPEVARCLLSAPWETASLGQSLTSGF